MGDRLIINNSGSSGNNLIIQSDGKKLLVDLGIGHNRILKSVNYKIDDWVAAICSHRHTDHTKSLDYFIRMGIPCYGNDDVCAHHEGCRPLPKVLKLDGFKVQHFDLDHNVPNTAFVIDLDSGIRVLYVTDTRSVRKRVKNVNYAIIECNYDDDTIIDNMSIGDYSRSHPENHMSLEACIDYLHEIHSPSLQGVVLWHLSSSNVDEGRAMSSVMDSLGFERVYIARSGIEIEMVKDEF